MPSPSPIARCGLSLALTMLVAACDSSTDPSDRGPSAVIFLSPPASVALGGTVQLSVATLNSQGVAVSGYAVSWQSLTPGVASVSGSGLVTGLSAGTATIRASSGERDATVILNVERATCVVSPTMPTYTPMQSVNLTVGPTDCLLYGSYAAVGRRIDISAPTNLRFSLSSTQHPVLLYLTDAQMNGLASDAVDANAVASISATLAAGTYYVWAALLDQRPNGSFTLSSATYQPCVPGVTAGTISVGQGVSGNVTASSCVLPNSQLAEGWAFSVSDSTTLRFDANASAITPLLWATRAQDGLPLLMVGTPLSATENVLLFRFGPGAYRIWVSSLDGRTGGYTLQMDTATFESCEVADGSIAVGETVAGTLSLEDCRLQYGEYADVYELTVASPTTLQIDQRSDVIDTYLYVRTLAGTTVAEDDDGGDFTNSRIVYSFAPGTYRILAAGYSLYDIGAYTLSVQMPAAGGAALRAPDGSVKLTRLREPQWDSPPQRRAGEQRTLRMP